MKKIDYTTYKKPTDFAHFEQGDTTIRIISSGGMVKKHGMRSAGRYVPLGDCTETPECKQCLRGNEPKQKWIWIAYLRSTKEAKILDVGAMLGDAICQLAQERQQDPQEFDIIVNRVGKGLDSKYKARAIDGAPLTDEELAKTKYQKQFLIKKYLTEKT